MSDLTSGEPEGREPPAIVEARRWVAECADGHRAETMEALFEGNDVALHWAAKALAFQDMVEALVEYLDEISAPSALQGENPK